jgi:membrane protein involved in colicin uptake
MSSGAVILSVLIAVGLFAYLLWQSADDNSSDQAPPDPEKVVQAAVELHRIRRRLDLADLRHRQRRDAAQLKREIADALDDDP